MSLSLPFFKYLAAVLLLGTNGIVASHIDLASYEIVLTRAYLGSIFLAVLCLVTHEKMAFLRYQKDTIMLLVSGMTLGVGWSAMYEAYVRVGVGIATLLNYAGPMIVLAASPFLFGEKWTRPLILSVIMVIGGMGLLNQNAAGSSLDSIGLLCGILSAVMYAAMVILTKKATCISGLSCSLLTLLGASIVVTAFVLAKQGALPTVSAGDYLPVLMLGIVNTGFTCYLYFSAMQKLPVRTVSICGYIEPISAVVFSMLLLGESLSLVQLLGGAFILGGAIYGEYSARKKRSHRQITAVL